MYVNMYIHLYTYEYTHTYTIRKGSVWPMDGKSLVTSCMYACLCVYDCIYIYM